METNPIRLLVLDRGFVVVARCPEPTDYGLWLKVTDLRTVRRWGTTNRGLGALSRGPTQETVLDEIAPAATIPVRAVLYVMEVEQAAWEPHLIPPLPLAAETRRGRRAATTA